MKVQHMSEVEQLQETIARLEADVLRSQRAEEILRSIAQGTAAATGKDFFYSLVYHLAQTLHVDQAFITECLDSNAQYVRTLAIWKKTDFTANVEYALAATPCETVIKSASAEEIEPIIYFPSDVQLLYPLEHGIESYLGIALRDTSRRVIGHIAIMHSAALQDEPLTHSALRIFAIRAAAELQRKHAETALRDSQERYKMLFESTPLSVFVYEITTLRFLAVNQAAVRHYGYSNSTFLTLRLTDILAPNITPDVEAWLQQAMSMQHHAPSVTQHIRSDRTLMDVEVTLRLVTFDGRAACLVLVHDITERKRIENEQLIAYQTMERRVEARTREIQRRRQVAESLRDILALLNTSQPLEFVLGHIVAQAQQILKSDAGAMYQLQGSRYLVQATRNLRINTESLSASLTQAMTEGIDTGSPLGYAQTGENPFASILIVPILIQEEPYGCLLLYYETDHDFTDEEKELGSMFADQTALAVENARLRKKAEEMAAMEERNRIARELHDAVSQTLWSAKLIADVLPDIWEQNAEKGRDKFRQFQQLTQAALIEMRSLLLELRPNALIETELGVLLHRLAQSTTARTGVPISVYINGSHKLPNDVHIAFYRITQEALNNVSRHALARMAEVSLVHTSQGVTLIIRDNGRGFVPDQVESGHHGITIMRERSASIGAHLEIMSRLGEGTAVKLVWLREAS